MQQRLVQAGFVAVAAGLCEVNTIVSLQLDKLFVA